MRDDFGYNLTKYIKTNWSLRRIFVLLFGWTCVLVCVSVVIGWINLSLLQTIGLLFLGLLAIEWAG